MSDGGAKRSHVRIAAAILAALLVAAVVFTYLAYTAAFTSTDKVTVTSPRAGLVMDRAALAERIGERVDRMVADGARGEVERAAATASPTARKALGFEELLAGDVEAMKARTRRYAKRQLTWMRKLPDVRTLDVTGRDAADVAAELHGMIEP